jgi:2-polyprenyl-3-methyl-5-hydroxy-6-metoxy-1,4-benzoquinol methylase
MPCTELPSLDVLEIGVGQGAHAQLLAPEGRTFEGIDLTEAASQATAKRIEVFGLAGRRCPRGISPKAAGMLEYGRPH